MAAPTNNQETPSPDATWKQAHDVDAPPRRSLVKMARLWRPAGQVLEAAAATLSRYALRLIDRTTGRAFSADELATDANSPVKAAIEANGIVYNPAITGLTGGGATKLDGIATVGVDVGRIQAVSASSDMVLYRLEDGTLAEDGLAVVRPDDYAVTTNEKIWMLVSLALNSITLCGDSSNVSVLSPGAISGTSNLPPGGGDLKPMPTMDLASPATGFTITASTLYSADVTCYLTPAGTLATGTFNLPAVAGVYVGQVVRVHSTQTVTSVTVAVTGGGTISGAAVTTFAAGVTYAWQCVSTSGAGTWIRL